MTDGARLLSGFAKYKLSLTLKTKDVSSPKDATERERERKRKKKACCGSAPEKNLRRHVRTLTISLTPFFLLVTLVWVLNLTHAKAKTF